MNDDETFEEWGRSGGICRSIDDLPVSATMRQRPVYARATRREWFRPFGGGEPEMPPPTDEEIHDAIVVLAATWDGDIGFGDMVHVEATRILDGCGAS